MIIEFIGLPGSGKSTVMRQFFAERPTQETRYLSEEAALLVVARRKFDRILRTPLNLLPRGFAIQVCPRFWWKSRQRAECQVRFLARHGAALGAFTSSGMYEAMSTGDRFRVIENFLEAGAFHEFLDDPEMADRIVLVGEGMVQKSFMFVDHSDVVVGTAEVARYLEKIPLPDLVIHLRVPQSVSFERMTGRASGLTQRLKAVDETAVRRFVAKAAHHLEFLSEWFTRHHPDRIFTIDNLDSAASATAHIRTRLASL